MLSPRNRFWLLTLAALLGLGTTLSAGWWQMQRGAQKQALFDAMEVARTLPELGNDRLVTAEDVATLRHQKARLRGQWMASHTVFLENRQMDGQPGFYVLTPMWLDGGNVGIVVQRGWVPRDFQDRTRLPVLRTPSGVVEVQGQLASPPGKLYEFATGSPGPIRQNLDMDAFAQEIGKPLLNASLVQLAATDAQDARDLRRSWPALHSGVDRHYAYAAQWVGLAALIAIFYVWFQFVAPRRA